MSPEERAFFEGTKAKSENLEGQLKSTITAYKKIHLVKDE